MIYVLKKNLVFLYNLVAQKKLKKTVFSAYFEHVPWYLLIYWETFCLIDASSIYQVSQINKNQQQYDNDDKWGQI